MNALKKVGLVLFCLLLFVGSVCLAIWIVRPQWLSKIDETEDEGVVMEQVDEEESRAQTLLSSMSLEAKVGQFFFIRCPLDEQLEKTMKLQPGGVLLFGRDFDGKTAQEVIDKNAQLQAMSEYPLLIGVDEEGGVVNRVSWNPQLVPSPFPSPQALYQEGGLAEVIQDAKIKSQYLLDYGIHVNLAPVSDVAEQDAYIYPRTVGLDPQGTAAYVAAVVDAMNEMKIGSCLKHFPGYGNNIDTHEEIAVDYREASAFFDHDFIPFRWGIEHQVPSILVAHTIVPCFDDVPASLSAKVHQILREDLNFQGVIISDDLSMQAIRQFTQQQDPSVQAFLAGNDLLITSDMSEGFIAIQEAVKKGIISEARLDESVERILNWKLALNLIE